MKEEPKRQGTGPDEPGGTHGGKRLRGSEQQRETAGRENRRRARRARSAWDVIRTLGLLGERYARTAGRTRAAATLGRRLADPLKVHGEVGGKNRTRQAVSQQCRQAMACVPREARKQAEAEWASLLRKARNRTPCAEETVWRVLDPGVAGRPNRNSGTDSVTWEALRRGATVVGLPPPGDSVRHERTARGTGPVFCWAPEDDLPAKALLRGSRTKAGMIHTVRDICLEHGAGERLVRAWLETEPAMAWLDENEGVAWRRPEVPTTTAPVPNVLVSTAMTMLWAYREMPFAHVLAAARKRSRIRYRREPAGGWGRETAAAMLDSWPLTELVRGPCGGLDGAVVRRRRIRGAFVIRRPMLVEERMLAQAERTVERRIEAGELKEAGVRAGSGLATVWRALYSDLFWEREKRGARWLILRGAAEHYDPGGFTAGTETG